MRHFNLEAVTVGLDLIQLDCFQGPSPETFVSPGRIGKRHPGNDLNIFRRAFAQDQSAQRPVNYPDTVQISRAKNRVGILRGFEEHRDVVRIVRKIAIQLKNEVIALLEGPFETGNISTAQSILFSSMQNMD